MSLTAARMVNLLQARFFFRLAFLSSTGLIGSGSIAFSQQNLLRDSDPASAASYQGPEGNAPAAEEPRDGLDVVSRKPDDQDSSAVVNPTKDANKSSRDPIVLPALGIPNTSIKGIGTGATPEDKVAGRMPAMVQLPFGQNRYGYWPLESKTWTAPVFCHQPTYFEDVMLERHGHEFCPPIQPILSGARFFGDVALMPYNAYLNPPLRDIPNTGYYRPGSTAPGIRQRPTYDKGAIRFQLLTTGTSFLAMQP